MLCPSVIGWSQDFERGGAEISHRHQLYVYRVVYNIEFIVA